MNFTIPQWRWEWQRRDPKYQKAFAVYQPLKVKLEAKYGPVAGWTNHLLQDEPDAWHYDPDKRPTESDNEWQTRAFTEGYDPRKSLIHEGMARKWGLAQMYDPEKGYEQGVTFLPEPKVPIWTRIEDVEPGIEESEERVPSFLYVRVDATRSASRQLAEVRKRLVAQQRRLKKEGLNWRTALHRKKWPLYLKVLDGLASGKPAKELAAQLFPYIVDQDPHYLGQARVRDTHKQALLLVNGGYRRIRNHQE